jgi:hypothetical protein
VRSIILSSLNGSNGTVFAFGHQGCGKTYIMFGKNQNFENIKKGNLVQNTGLIF